MFVKEKPFKWLGLHSPKGGEVLVNPDNIRFISKEEKGCLIALSSTDGKTEALPVTESIDEILAQLIKIFA